MGGAEQTTSAQDPRGTFREQVLSMAQRLRRDGVLIRKIRAFDQLGPGRTVARDALVIVDVHREGIKLGAFLGRASNLAVVAKVTPRDGATLCANDV